jgi:hypothetical protein
MQPSAQEQINILYRILTEAQISFDLWEGLREARSAQDTVDAMQRYAVFFTGAESAMLGSFIVLLYSLYETRWDTVNFHTLLRTLNPDLPPAENANLDACVKALKATWIKLGILRNEVVGHQALDRSPYESFSKAAVSPQEIRDYLIGSQTLLGHISSTVFNTCLAFNIKGKPYLERLLTDMRSNNSLKADASGAA